MSVIIIVVTPVLLSLAEFLVSFVCEHESVFHTTAAFQNIWVFGVVVAFADNICRTEFELFW